MDLKEFYVIDNINNINYIDCSDEEYGTLINYDGICYETCAVYQLYKIFEYNYDQLVSVFGHTDFTELNALLINMISSGKSLYERLEIVINKYNTPQYDIDKFKKFASEEYDKSFAYRFLSHMRNYVQHTHVPISFDEKGVPCFDCQQIVSTPHFKLNAALKDELINNIRLVREKNLDTFTLSFEPIVLRYAKSIMTILVSFKIMFQDVYMKYISDFYNVLPLINKKMYGNELKYKNLVFFMIDGDAMGGLHVINPSECVIEQYKTRMAEILLKATIIEEQIQEMNNRIKVIPL